MEKERGRKAAKEASARSSGLRDSSSRVSEVSCNRSTPVFFFLDLGEKSRACPSSELTSVATSVIF